MLRRHQFDAAVQRAVGVVSIGAHRRQEAHSCSTQPRLRDTRILRKFSDRSRRLAMIALSVAIYLNFISRH